MKTAIFGLGQSSRLLSVQCTFRIPFLRTSPQPLKRTYLTDLRYRNTTEPIYNTSNKPSLSFSRPLSHSISHDNPRKQNFNLYIFVLCRHFAVCFSFWTTISSVSLSLSHSHCSPIISFFASLQTQESSFAPTQNTNLRAPPINK